MADSLPTPSPEAPFTVRTFYVRHRNVLLAKADFGELYVDYYLHLSENNLHPSAEHDALFKRALAGFALHCASRPWNEMSAWTLNFQNPLVNLFLTGDNEVGSVAGRVFSEHVRELEENVFYADVVRTGSPKRRSTVNFTGADPLQAIETLYQQSEQRPARYFQTGEEEFVLVSAHPDCDQPWFDALTVDAVRSLEQSETVTPMESRLCRWHCGCTHDRMMQVLLPIMKQDPAGLFGEEAKVEIRCPRCSARYNITREAMEAYVVGK
jgi:molecular chaperone Hsp33